MEHAMVIVSPAAKECIMQPEVTVTLTFCIYYKYCLC